ncbi:hypothetical protein FDP41_004358 [Naegleria fowleri]|uniref:tRNA threonylcarbamoyladenosine biosynthesis protein TsaE n=1 Tax=Naegleria fowleri TaxID=5763 RepID=A0A6A5BU96_NAEFO|nr:uncharacterized protein FDP41_004358 [Naegleria fowleri]KAF0976459.1 hypothetical protein FDP41_004358 [Naegleria fowleri]
MMKMLKQGILFFRSSCSRNDRSVSLIIERIMGKNRHQMVKNISSSHLALTTRRFRVGNLNSDVNISLCRNYGTACLNFRENSCTTDSSMELSNQSSQWFEKSFPVQNIEGTRTLAEKFSKLLQNTDVVLLTGDMGSGKSVFARHVIRVLEKDMNLNVPSPTFLLDNLYENKLSGNFETIHHIDLYRLDRFDRLDLLHVFTNGISLIEWGNRLLEDNDLMKQPHHSYIREVLLDSSKCHLLIILFENVATSSEHDGETSSNLTFNEEHEARSITFSFK